MAEIKPFRGIRYNEEVIRELAKVTAPPYDVINPRQREELSSRSPFNVVRIELPEGKASERYRNAREIYLKWIRDKVLVRDNEPSIYPYYQDFEFEGQKYKRKGFIAIVKVEEFDRKIILPHEQTFKKHKEDRLALTLECNSNLSQIFCVYPDSTAKAEEIIDDNIADSVADVTSEEGIRNRLWKISDPKVIRQVENCLKDKTLLIADGHHRYETSINFRNLKREQTGESSEAMPFDYVMMYLSRGEGDGLIINPTHRIVANIGGNLIENLEDNFELERIPLESSTVLGPNQISLVTKDPGKTFRLTPKKSREKSYENLAVIILHDLILKGLTEEEKTKVKYSKFPEEVFQEVHKGGFNAGFLLPKLKSEDIFKVVLDGAKMPHKTTYFYPKILSGLVFNPLW